MVKHVYQFESMPCKSRAKKRLFLVSGTDGIRWNKLMLNVARPRDVLSF